MRTFILLSTLVFVAVSGGKNRPSGSGTNTDSSTSAPATTAAPETEASCLSDVCLYGAQVAALTSTSSVSANSDCGDNAEGYFEEYVTGDTKYIIVSGAPNHAAEYGQVHANPNTRCERWQYIAADLEWSDSGSTHTTMGTTGYVMSGGTVFDPRSSTDGSLASYYEWDSLDPSYGHSDNSFQYHYHAVPALWSSSSDSSACEHIGYMIDGGKLYGYCEVDGVQVESCYVQNSADTPTNESDYTYTAGCGLDECNMMEINGEMAYVITPNWPYVPPCLKGNVASIKGFTP